MLHEPAQRLISRQPSGRRDAGEQALQLHASVQGCSASTTTSHFIFYIYFMVYTLYFIICPTSAT